MRVLVTGGAGFLGSHLVDRLIDNGHTVAVLDNFSSGRWGNLATAWGEEPKQPPRGPSGWFQVTSPWRPLTVQQGSVSWSPDLGVIIAFRPDVVYHLAAQIDVRRSAEQPVADADTNVVGTVRALQAARQAGAERFVFVSSAATLGDNGDDLPLPRKLTDPYRPISPYGAAKAAGEMYVRVMGLIDPGAFSTAVAVLPNVYGPRQAAGFGAVNLFTRALLTGEDVVLYGDGRNVRDYIHVSDVIDALVRLASVTGEDRVLVGTGVGTTDEELLDIVAGAIGTVPTVRWAPARVCDVRNAVLPLHRLSLPVTLRVGVRDTVDAIRKELGL